jgi:rRNA-processing protein CGR1
MAEENAQIRGQPKSGKFWKTPKEKFRKVQKSLSKKTKDQHLKLRQDLKRVKELSRQIKVDKKQACKILRKLIAY